MKKFVLFLFFSLISFTAFAQFIPNELDTRHGKIVYYKDGEATDAGLMTILGNDEFSSYQTAKSLKSWGRGLIIGGAATAATGIALAVAIPITQKEPLDAQSKAITTSIISVGVALTIPGIVLSCIGKSKVNNIVERYNMKMTPGGIAYVF